MQKINILFSILLCMVPVLQADGSLIEQALAAKRDGSWSQFLAQQDRDSMVRLGRQSSNRLTGGSALLDSFQVSRQDTVRAAFAMQSLAFIAAFGMAYLGHFHSCDGLMQHVPERVYPSAGMCYAENIIAAVPAALALTISAALLVISGRMNPTEERLKRELQWLAEIHEDLTAN